MHPSQKPVENPAGLDRFNDLHDAITLGDILADRHLPPLSLKDFEQYLCFETRSLENLYFILWLNDYKKLYDREAAVRSEMRSEWDSRTCQSLVQAVTRAKSTFFEAGSSFELDIAACTRRAVLMEPYPLCPLYFSQTRQEVEGALQTSFETFVMQSYRNVGRRYRILIGLFGLILVQLSFLALALLIHFNQSRWLRLIMWLPLALGIGFLGAGFSGVCSLIYIFGSGKLRQIHQYERIEEDIDADLALTIVTPSTACIEDLEMGLGHKPLPAKPRSKRLTATFITFPSNPTTVARKPSLCPRFDFDGLPSATLPKGRTTLTPRPLDLPAGFALQDVPCFAPLTKVFSEVTKKAQWRKVALLIVVDLILATLITMPVMFIPVRR